MKYPDPLHLRLAGNQHDTFFQQVYAETREDLQGLDSNDAVIAQLIRMQYQAQKQGYQQDYPDANYYVIEWQGEACGRLILYQRLGFKKAKQQSENPLYQTLRYF
jgi:hypothetical protein